MDVTMLLCDAAQEVGGKLYILGGGWSVLKAEVPAPMALAIKVSVPWDQTNERHQLSLTLKDADGRPIDLGEGPIQAGGEFEVGRPAGTKRGSPIDAPIVVNFPPVPFPAGGYVWELEVDGSVMARVPFSAIN